VHWPRAAWARYHATVRGKAILFGSVVFVLAAGGALAWWLLGGGGSVLGAELALELERRGVVLVLSEDPAFPGSVTATGTELRRVELASVEGHDDAALIAQMEELGADAILVDGRGAPPAREVSPDATLRERLVAYAPTERLRATYLSPEAALYVPAISASLPDDVRAALPRIARRLVAGETPPRTSAYPEPLRRIQSVEVMVLLRDGEVARLWRSARGSSIARALQTAAVVARQRWEERENAMGGPLDERLSRLEIEVSLLEEDGTLGSTAPAFVERVFTGRHGVAYERPGAWRYLLPEATRSAGEGSAVAAYRQLFQDNALPADSLRRPDLRFYRLVVSALGSSPAPGLGSDSEDGEDASDSLGDDAMLDSVESSAALAAPSPG